MGAGKSAIPLTVAYFQRRIVLVLVPLIGLGSNQVSKSSSIHNPIYSYHLYKHKYDTMIKFKDGLLCMDGDEVHNTRIILIFSSPQSLSKQSKWFYMINQLFQKRYISFICNLLHTTDMIAIAWNGNKSHVSA